MTLPTALPPAPTGTDVTAGLLARLAEVGPPALSPDGASVCALIDRGGRREVRWHGPSGPPEGRALATNVLDVQPRWLPDGRLAWLAAGPSGEAVLTLAGPPGGPHTEHRLPFPTGELGQLHPTATACLLLRRAAGRGRVVSVDQHTGACREISGDDLDVRDLAAAPDGGVVVVAHLAHQADQADQAGPALLRLLPGGPELLSAEARAPGSRERLLDLSADGRRVLYGHDDGDGRCSLWWHDLATGEGRPVPDVGPGTVLAARWCGDDVLVQAFHRVRGVLRQVPPPNRTGARAGGARELVETGCAYPGFDVAPESGTIAFRAQRPTAPPELWSLSLDRPTARRVSRTHPPLRTERLGRVAEIHWPGARDGRRVDGLLIRPSDAPPDLALPTVVLLHGGPHHHWHHGWHGSWSDWGQLLAARGFAVLCPNVRGSTGRDWAYTHAVRGDLAELPLADTLAGVDQLVAAGLADPARLGVGGWSYGAYLAGWALTRTNRFRAAAIGAGIYDMAALVRSPRLGPAWRGFFPGADLSDDAPYDAVSPLHRAVGASTATLLVHGTEDSKVEVGHSRRMHRALSAAGATTRLVELAGEGHTIQDEESRLRLLSEVEEWFTTHL
ncbi:S9 family peptidase [Streptomyces profundus]|uniref:S9 family peptidase n=1 Tax=Streptomyces profundus TaxID=2867410 RepID=UPI001D165EC5|nr:prolyl oligopeptidase family serine peptidase [Streptomyces sp. MA3_2.13]UED85948.1 prolyl oligopeptidase family serine peptidase [Streptomyces sp. MA3_2.13]